MLLRSLSPGNWERATSCSGWTVKDIVAHLLDGDLWRLSRQRDALPPLPSDRPLATNSDLIAWQNTVAAPGTQVLIEIRGEEGGQWTLRKQDNGWQLYTGRGENPATVVTLDDDLAWHLFSKGITPGEGQRHTEINGDPFLAQPLFKIVRIMA